MLRPKLILYTSQAWPLACSAARGLSAGAAEAGAPASRAAASAATGAPVAATPAPPAGSSSSAAGPAAVAPPNALAQRYAQLLAGGALRPDARQAAVVARLAVLLDELGPYCGRMRAYKDELEEFKVRTWGLQTRQCCVCGNTEASAGAPAMRGAAGRSIERARPRRRALARRRGGGGGSKSWRQKTRRHCGAR